MSEKWPFSRARPAGFVTDDIPTASELDKIDRICSQAADGLSYTDAVLPRNWVNTATLTSRGDLVFWTGMVWITMHEGGTGPVASYSVDGKRWIPIRNSFGEIFSTLEIYVSLLSAAVNTGGNVVVVADRSTNVQTVILSTDFGFTWSRASTPWALDTQKSDVAWAPSANLFVLSTDAGLIATSPTGTAWTARTLPSSYGPGYKLAASPTAIIRADGMGRVYRSVDGIAWTLVDATNLLPKLYEIPLYIPGLAKFIIWDSSSGFSRVSTDDGLTWSSGPFGPSTIKSAVAFGRMIVCVDTMASSEAVVRYSVDGGVSWTIGTIASNAPGSRIALGRGQLLFADTGGVHYASIALGP